MTEKIKSLDTLAMQVTDALRKDIICKNFKEDSKITIKQISELYGVSNMPVREAFRTLEGEGLIKILPHKGAEVRSIDVDFVCNAYEVNAVLETLMFENAMDELPTDVLVKLRGINDKIRCIEDKPEDLIRYLDLNYQLHETVFKYNHNHRAYELFNYQNSLLRTLRSAYTPVYTRIQEAYLQHERILDALSDKDKPALRIAVKDHITSAMENFMSQYTEK